MGSTVPKDFRQYLVDEGIDYELVRQKRHPVIELHYNGRKKRMALPKTAGDWRAIENFKKHVKQFKQDRLDDTFR